MSKVDNIIKKEKKTEYEVGSGSLYIPILGDLFPKLFGQQMKEVNIFFITTSKSKYEVSEEVYLRLKIGDIFKK